MKAIGKKSIASMLAIGLHGVRIVLWLGFMGLSVALFVLPVIFITGSFDEGWLTIDVDDGSRIGDFIEVLAHWFTFGVLLFVVDRLIELLKTLRFGTPFVAENADRFRRIGYALLIGEAAKIGFGILGAIFDSDYHGGIDLITLIAIAAVFVLSEVFHEGARMKEEQDLTV